MAGYTRGSEAVNARAVLARDPDQVAGAPGLQHLRTPLPMHVSAAQLEALRRDKEISRRVCVIRRGRRREPVGGGHESQPLSRASRRPVRPRDSHIEYSRLSSLSRRCQGAVFPPARRGVAVRRTGINPGNKLSASAPNSEQLEPALDNRIPSGTPGSFRLGAGRSQVQILSPRLEDPANRFLR